MIARYRERQGCTKTRAFLLIVICHAVDRGASPGKIPSVQSQPATGREGIGDVCLAGVNWFLARVWPLKKSLLSV